MNIQSVWHWLQSRAENIVALLLASMFTTFLIQILFRYVLGLPLGWTVEYVTVAWLWGILFGYAFVVREADVIRLDLLYAALPRTLQRASDVIGGLIVAGIMLYSMPKAYDFVTFMHIERTAFMRIPFDYIFAIYLPFAASIIIRALIGVWKGLRGERLYTPSIEIAEAHDYD